MINSAKHKNCKMLTLKQTWNRRSMLQYFFFLQDNCSQNLATVSYVLCKFSLHIKVLVEKWPKKNIRKANFFNNPFIESCFSESLVYE